MARSKWAYDPEANAETRPRWGECRLCGDALEFPRAMPRRRQPLEVEANCPSCPYLVEYTNVSFPRHFTERWLDDGREVAIHYFTTAIYFTGAPKMEWPRDDGEAPPPPKLIPQSIIVDVQARARGRRRNDD